MSTTLILTMVGLLFLLIGLVFLYVWVSRTRKHVVPVIEPVESFETLSAILQSPLSSNAQLHLAVSRILERFAHIESHRLSKYKQLVEAVCVHAQSDSKLVLRFEKGLRTVNPAYSSEIEQALSIGLAARS